MKNEGRTMELTKENLKNVLDIEYKHMSKWSSATGIAMALIQKLRKDFNINGDENDEND